MHQHLENCSCPNLLPFLKSLQPIPDTLSSFSSEAVDTIQLRGSPLYTVCLCQRTAETTWRLHTVRFSYWKEPQVNDNTLFLCVYNKASSSSRTFPGQLGSWPFPSQRAALPLSSCFQHLLPGNCCCLYWATHGLPLSATMLSLAALNCSKQRLGSRFPFHTIRLTLYPCRRQPQPSSIWFRVCNWLDLFQQSSTWVLLCAHRHCIAQTIS